MRRFHTLCAVLTVAATAAVALGTVDSQIDARNGTAQKLNTAGKADVKQDDWDNKLSLLTALNIVECGPDEPYECHVYVSSVALNRFDAVYAANKTATLKQVLYQKHQFTGMTAKKCKGAPCMEIDTMTRSLKFAIIGAEEALNSDKKRVTSATHYLNPRYVMKTEGHLPRWALTDYGALKEGKFVGSHYFLDEKIPFAMN